MTDAEIIADLREQLAKAKAQNLTRDEAECLLWELDRNKDHPYFTAYAFAATIAKLRSLSSLRSSGLGEQNDSR